MKFVCERCQTRYSIADDKVRQKILKIRCKTCASVITVRESSAQVTGGPVAGATSSAGAPAFSPSVSRPPPPPAPAEWYYSLDGQQEGPFTLPEIAKSLDALKKDDEVYIWREDFDSWMDLKDVPAVLEELR